MPDVVVVGAGPNGLAAAITCAEAGRSVLVLEASDAVGGGTRTDELTLPGFHHDVCSAIHPLAAVSPFFAEAGLQRHGLELLHPDVALVQPLDGGRAGVLHRSLEETVAGYPKTDRLRDACAFFLDGPRRALDRNLRARAKKPSSKYAVARRLRALLDGA